MAEVTFFNQLWAMRLMVLPAAVSCFLVIVLKATEERTGFLFVPPALRAFPPPSSPPPSDIELLGARVFFIYLNLPVILTWPGI